jgi:hypothetical protein
MEENIFIEIRKEARHVYGLTKKVGSLKEVE